MCGGVPQKRVSVSANGFRIYGNLDAKLTIAFSFFRNLFCLLAHGYYICFEGRRGWKRPREPQFAMQLILQILGAALNLCTVISAYVGSQKTMSNSNKSLGSPFGVGFDLTASYGSAAVSFSNGTIVTVAQIPGNQDYNDVLRRLSLAASRHLSPPYNKVGEAWDDMPRQYLRKARKAVGLPASQDVGHLAKMLSGLRTVVEERVGPIMTAGLTTMHLAALYDEDLHDAFEYVGLKYITIPIGAVGHNILYETSAAYAGYGYGLCSDYKGDPEARKNQQWNMTDQAVMAVVYTDTALSVSFLTLHQHTHCGSRPIGT